MSSKHILKLLAALPAIAAVTAGAFSTTAFAYDYYYDETYSSYSEQGDTGSQQEQSVEYIPQEVAPDTVYIPPEPSASTEYDYFDDYRNETDPDYGYSQYGGDYTAEGEVQTENADAETSAESSEESSGLDPEEISVDTQELTSKDWEKIQNNLTSKGEESKKTEKSEASVKPAESSAGSSGSGEDFGTLKNKSTKEDKNDAWIYLAIGIPLLLAGIALIVVVIVVNVRAKKKETEPEAANEAPEADPLADGEEDKVINKPKRSAFGAKHVAPVKPQSRDVVQKDLVDTLDAPESENKK